MKTIIQIAESKDNVSKVIILPKGRRPEYPDLNPSEIDRIWIHHEEKEINLFEISHANSIIFIHYVELKGSHQAQLETMRKEGQRMLTRLNSHKLEEILLSVSEQYKEFLPAYSEGMLLGSYQFLKYKSNTKDSAFTLKSILADKSDISSEVVNELNILTEAVYKCRDLVNEPVSELNAVALGEEFERMGKSCGATVEVFGKKKIEALKMGGLLAVNKGSIDPPTFTIMEYKPESPVNSKPLILVGKGVVFDTGGMNIKTGDFMTAMKCDMAGAATAASALYAVAMQRLNIHLIALLPATDNRLCNNAMVPGDVINMFDGTKVEVLNTDAEGRLILADALSYAGKYNPALCISIATLTGAASRAIGKHGTVAMQNAADKHMELLSICGENVYERLAVFPFWDEYGEMIKSEVADIKNIAGADAGMITAGKFLAHFTSYPFIHLDIAGTAFFDKAEAYQPSGGTGIGVRLIYEFCRQLTINKNHADLLT